MGLSGQLTTGPVRPVPSQGRRSGAISASPVPPRPDWTGAGNL